MPCRAGCGLCLVAWSSSRSQPPSGQPATGRMSRPPFRRSQQLSLPRRFHRRRRLLPRRSSTNARRPPAAPAVQQAAAPPAAAPPPAPGAPPAPPVVQAAPAPLPAAPNPAPNAGQQAASPPALAPRPSASSAPPRRRQRASVRSGARSPSRHYRRPRPDGRRSKSRAYLRPRTSRSWSGPGPIPRGIAIGCSSGAAAAGPFANQWTSSPRPLLSSRRRRSFCLPPPAGLIARLKRTARSR